MSGFADRLETSLLNRHCVFDQCPLALKALHMISACSNHFVGPCFVQYQRFRATSLRCEQRNLE